MKNIIFKILFRLFYIFLYLFRKIVNFRSNFNSSINVKFLGSKYGGFYVNVKEPKSIDILLSFGIGEDITFDTELNDLTNCKVFMFDPTEGVSDFVKDQKLNSKFIFFPIGISISNVKTKFFKPRNKEDISHSLIKHENTSNEFYYSDFKKWETICDELSLDKVDVLKMDIEGSEFEVVEDILTSKILPKQICIEIHPRFVKNGIFKFFKLLNQFKKHNYSLIAINDSGNEFLFIM